jgi:hypothetical protein
VRGTVATQHKLLHLRPLRHKSARKPCPIYECNACGTANVAFSAYLPKQIKILVLGVLPVQKTPFERTGIFRLKHYR